MSFDSRSYRSIMNSDRFRFFNIVEKETDLWIGISHSCFEINIPLFCAERVRFYRTQLENYIKKNSLFGNSFEPIHTDLNAPSIAICMMEASKIAGTGPMAAVAGAFAEFIGNDLLKKFKPEELIIENGGDVFVIVKRELSVQFYAGKNQKFKDLLISVPENLSGLGVCTSSGMFGHSFSYGKADSVTVLCKSAALADAFATSFGNKIEKKQDISSAIKSSKAYSDILGIIIIKDDELGIRGNFPIKLT